MTPLQAVPASPASVGDTHCASTVWEGCWYADATQDAVSDLPLGAHVADAATFTLGADMGECPMRTDEVTTHREYARWPLDQEALPGRGWQGGRQGPRSASRRALRTEFALSGKYRLR